MGVYSLFTHKHGSPSSELYLENSSTKIKTVMKFIMVAAVC